MDNTSRRLKTLRKNEEKNIRKKYYKTNEEYFDDFNHRCDMPLLLVKFKVSQ